MPWTKRVCRFLHTHWVFRQEADQSCGPSCALMLFERERGAKLDAVLSYRAVDDYGRGGLMAAYDGSVDTVVNELARMVRNVLGQGATGHGGVLGGRGVNRLIRDNLSAGNPVIARVDWLPGHGGHFVLLDRLTSFLGSQYLCICDPWDQHVHPIEFKPDNLTVYRPAYDGEQKMGIFDGDVVELT